MSRVKPRGEQIRSFILNHVQQNPSAISKLAAEHFGVTRQAVNTHLSRLVSEGALTETGATKGKRYELAPMTEWTETFQLGGATVPAEDMIWRTKIAPVLGPLPDNVQRIWSFGFTEMFNNAVDHSEGSAVTVHIVKTAVSTEMLIADNGVGIFRKIQRALSLEDERHAILELSKGKLTTDPTRHSGEGIFFTSRAFDAFDILSGGVYFSHEFGRDEDWLTEVPEPTNATGIFLRLSNHSSRSLPQVYEQYTDGPDDYGFSKTVVPVRLAQYGNDQLISRSQAKRVMARVELFSRVILNFEDVPSIGQAFADEVFRVFALTHPAIRIDAINTTPEIDRMIARARQGAEEDRGPKQPNSD